MSAWMVFSNVMFFTLVLDSSFSSNLARNFTFVLSGAKEIFKEGYDEKSISDSKINDKLLFDLFHASKEIYSKNLFYLWIAISCLSGWFVAITYQKSTILPALVVFLLGLLIHLVFSYNNVLLLGYNRVENHLKAQTFFRMMLSVAGVFAAFMFKGILALSFSFLISCLVYRLITYLYTRSIILKIANFQFKKDHDSIALVKSKIYHNSLKTLKIAISAFSITRLNVFIASYYLPYSVSASFSLTLQALASILSISQLPIVVQLPLISTLVVKKEFVKIRYKVFKCALISAIIFLGVFAVFYILGNHILYFLGSKTVFLEGGFLLLWGITFFFETNQSVFANYITALNKIPFLKSAFLSGLVTPILSIVLIHFYGADYSFLIISQFLVQMSYNNWKWPLFAIKDLEQRIKTYN